MKTTTRYGAAAAGLFLVAALLLTGCEDAVEKPSKNGGPTAP